MTQCLGGVVCECRFAPGVATTGEPGGYRWDCSLLRPRCADAALPATIDAVPYTPPSSIIVETPSYDPAPVAPTIPLPPILADPVLPSAPAVPQAPVRSSTAGRFITPFEVEVPSFVYRPPEAETEAAGDETSVTVD